MGMTPVKINDRIELRVRDNVYTPDGWHLSMSVYKDDVFVTGGLIGAVVPDLADETIERAARDWWDSRYGEAASIADAIAHGNAQMGDDGLYLVEFIDGGDQAYRVDELTALRAYELLCERYRSALQRIRDVDAELPCTFCEATEIVNAALEGKRGDDG